MYEASQITYIYVRTGKFRFHKVKDPSYAMFIDDGTGQFRFVLTGKTPVAVLYGNEHINDRCHVCD